MKAAWAAPSSPEFEQGIKVQSDIDIAYFGPDDCDLSAFRALTDQTLDRALMPRVSDVLRNILVYDIGALRASLNDPQARRDLMAEWTRG